MTGPVSAKRLTPAVQTQCRPWSIRTDSNVCQIYFTDTSDQSSSEILSEKLDKFRARFRKVIIEIEMVLPLDN